MKALSLASIVAVALGSAACAQSDVTTEPDAPVEVAETASTTSGKFNLGLPEELEPAPATTAGNFNLEVDPAAATATDGFNLSTEVETVNSLDDLPDIEDLVIDDPEAEEAVDAIEDLIDDEPVIRLE